MFDLDSPLVLVPAAIVILIGFAVYGLIVGKRNAKTLEDMMSEIETDPDRVVRSEGSDVALCWIEAGGYFVYLNVLTGTSRKIPIDEIHSLDVLENGLTIRHHVNTGQKKDIAEDIVDGINQYLPAQVKDKIERLEILLKTKTGGPPMGYSIPVIESDTSPTNKDYKALRNETVDTVDNWRSVIGLA